MLNESSYELYNMTKKICCTYYSYLNFLVKFTSVNLAWIVFFCNIFFTKLWNLLLSISLMLTWKFFYFKKRSFALHFTLNSIELWFYFCCRAPLKIYSFLALFNLTPIFSENNIVFFIFFNILIKLSLKTLFFFIFCIVFFYNIYLNKFYGKTPSLHNFCFLGLLFYCKNLILL